MPERKFAIKPVGVDYACDECEEGVMFRHGEMMLMTDPIQIPHKCNKCGAEKNFTEYYPTIRFERINYD